MLVIPSKNLCLRATITQSLHRYLFLGRETKRRAIIAIASPEGDSPKHAWAPQPRVTCSHSENEFQETMYIQHAETRARSNTSTGIHVFIFDIVYGYSYG